MLINAILYTVIISTFILTCYYIHKKRVGTNYIASYRWFTKILR